MRDRFMDSVKTKDEHVTEDGASSRKKSFARHFINALFSIVEEEENQSNEDFTAENRGMETDVPPTQRKVTAHDDEEMLKEVKELPQERKISVLMSIVYGLVGVDATTDENLPTISKREGTNGETNNSSVTTCTEVPSSIDNKGLEGDETELNPCSPDQNTGTTMDEELSCNVNPDLLHMNRRVSETLKCKPSIVSDDPESALPETPAPKTIRAWLTDPHLYRVFTSLLLK